MRQWWLGLVYLGCSEYEVKPQPDGPVGAGAPEIEVSPAALTLTGLCAPGSGVIDISNVGDGDLTLSDLRLSGSGFSTSFPALPLVLAPGEATVVLLDVTAGDATLTVESDDADEARIEVPLHAAANRAPEVVISSPAPGEVWDDGEDAVLEAVVSDDADPAETLALLWSASGTALSTAPALPDGSTSLSWLAVDRTSGPGAVRLEATDSCGQTGSAEVDYCQDGAYTYDALSISAWHYEGSAYWDATDEFLRLTAVAVDQVGTAFETTREVDAAHVYISFYFSIGGGTGADGLSLTVLDVARMSTFLGGTGCGIGYGGDASCTGGPALPGWTVEVDTYFNEGFDATSDDHLAFVFDGDVDNPELTVPVPELEDNGWHLLDVTVVAPRVTVALDGVTYIDQDLSGNFGFNGYVGFTAGTGSQTNSHVIDSLAVTDYACD